MTVQIPTLKMSSDVEKIIDTANSSLCAIDCTTSPASLQSMYNFELADRCMREIEHYRHGEPFEDRYGLELFRRALLQRDSSAWEVVQQRFNDIVHCWLRNHPMKQAASRFDSDENYVAQTFARFWQATAGNYNLKFTTMAAVLRYLRATLSSALLDTLRTYSRPQELALPEPYALSENCIKELCVDEPDENVELWEAIRTVLPNERQQRVAYLLFHCHLKPREIVRFCSQEFSSVEEVYRLRRNVFDRLLRNADYLRWRLASEPSMSV